ncbi:436_t:CDS:2 [Diversispora eburnea]|uniref:436_t:CDS:1 n=1 Tax=Diversispora eburnea TaxID=1213867 RepID=A0A9N9AAC2_9GLOM|nr:436_t:CDS:2 [Diversispora eburnea]
MVGTFLLTVIKNQVMQLSSPECMIEALNAIYDIYSDKNFDYDEPVFVRGGYLQLLERVIEVVHNMAKTISKNTSRDLRLRADEAKILKINVKLTDTFRDIKNRIPHTTTYTQLYYYNKKLEDDETLSDYNIKDDSTIACHRLL